MKTLPWPSAGEVHLYCHALPQQPAELARLGSFLTSNETDRAGLLKSERAMRRYIAGRGLLREILGGYLGVAARQVQLAAGPHGKPYLLHSGATFGFNLAHAGEYLLLAVTAGHEVGVDLEKVIPRKPFGEMARLVFSPDERDRLSRLSPPRLETTFYRYWVRKEACLKACGRGFTIAGNSFGLSQHDQEPAAMIACCDRKYWMVLDVDAPPGYCAAVAIEIARLSQSPPAIIRIDGWPSR